MSAVLPIRLAPPPLDSGPPLHSGAPLHAGPVPGAGFSSVVRVRLSELREADSPRLEEPDPAYVRVLAEAGDALPPILVHGQSMRVIDGVHRLSAARLDGGATHIAAQFFYGTAQEAFQLAVRANVTHGLPLTLAERQAAAARIIVSSPDLSDRSIAGIAGIAARTVAALRESFAADGAGSPQRRIGRDGKVRPLSTAEGRHIASQVIAASPDAPLREIARQAGISVGTARDVRARVRAGQDPVPAQQRDRAGASVRREEHEVEVDVEALLNGLRRDPSLCYTESGRGLLRWLASRTVSRSQADQVTAGLPAHCAIIVARIAREYARSWNEIADDLDRLETD
ncbi:transcriptional regulator protein [Plantactinospora sp. WMMC1484]|uniref:transcriptional regulator protein n=1 Tax=Plantactinospora sp. WMMC1484 TaxID=3404122 RepID=UPI003BF6040E